MHRPALFALLATSSLLVSVACSSTPAPMSAAELASLGVVNGTLPSPGVVTGGQLTQEQIEALAAAGYDVFINLRPVDEPGTGWEEEWAAAHGIRFHRLPVAGAPGVTVDAARRLHELMGESEGGVVVFCSSGNRVGALLALQAHFIDGLDPQASLEVGRRAGLTRAEPKVRELLGLDEAD